jgi:hypothetical protein
MLTKEQLKVAFIGDISLNDIYIEYFNEGKNPFENVQPLLNSSDYVVGNLECIARGKDGENLLRRPRLSTTVETLAYLNKLNLSVVSLAQNHVYDHLEDGFRQTTEFLKKNDIKYLGASLNLESFRSPIIISKEGVCIGFLNYVTEDTNPRLPDNAGVYLNIFDLDKVVADIQKIRATVDHVVLLLHWGGRVEGGLYPDFNQPAIAKKIIDAGADLIIGHHSHTLQPFEVYKGKYIFYSLGNFCFSDYVFEGKLYPLSKRQNISTIVTISFEKKTYQPQFDFFHNNKKSLVKIDYIKKLKARNLYYKLLFSNVYLWEIYFFCKNKILPILNFFKRDDIGFFDKMSRLVISMKKRFNTL